MTDSIRTQARIAADKFRTARDLGHDVYLTNPHPAGTEAHALWEATFLAVVVDGGAVEV